jgi:hypothetical protein
MGRWFAIVVALAVGIGGILPRWTAWRCTMTQAVASEPCCPAHQTSEATIGDPCCVAIQAPAQADRIGPRAPLRPIEPAPFTGFASFLPACTSAAPSLAAIWTGLPPPPRPSPLLVTQSLRI